MTVRQALVRGRFTTPKSQASRRTLPLGPWTVEMFQEQWQETGFREDSDLIFSHPSSVHLSIPASSRAYIWDARLLRPESRSPFAPGMTYGIPHSLTTRLPENPQAYVQMKAGHAQGSMTERYIHAAQVLFPGAPERAESRIFRELDAARGTKTGTKTTPPSRAAPTKGPVSRALGAPRVGLEPTTLRLTAGCSAN